MHSYFLGVVADDFTGASDAASFLKEAGIPTVLYNGIPAEDTVPEEIGAVVIALKSRTIPAQEAVRQSIAAFDFLHESGARKLYFKYCSTFDSTDEGNIGPVTDAVMEHFGFMQTLICPSLPVNGRTVRGGKLYVNGVPLAESPMKDHPLTPMRKSSLRELMKVQGKYPCVELSVEDMTGGLQGMRIPQEPYYLIPDYYEDVHGSLIAQTFSDLDFYTGGSGLVGALAHEYVKNIADAADAAAERTGTEGRCLLLAGSCSAMTRAQIRDYQERGYETLRLYPNALTEDASYGRSLYETASQRKDCLIYSSADPDEVQAAQSAGSGDPAAGIERTFSQIASLAYEDGYKRFIIAGGETSGAVTEALGFSAFRIGESAAPGVPVMTPLERPDIRLVLKSGNFGSEDFFSHALEMTQADEQ